MQLLGSQNDMATIRLGVENGSRMVDAIGKPVVDNHHEIGAIAGQTGIVAGGSDCKWIDVNGLKRQSVSFAQYGGES